MYNMEERHLHLPANTRAVGNECLIPELTPGSGEPHSKAGPLVCPPGPVVLLLNFLLTSYKSVFQILQSYS